MGEVVYRFGAVDRNGRTRIIPDGSPRVVAEGLGPDIRREGVDQPVRDEHAFVPAITTLTSDGPAVSRPTCAETSSSVATRISDQHSTLGQETLFDVINCGFLGVWAGYTNIHAAECCRVEESVQAVAKGCAYD